MTCKLKIQNRSDGARRLGALSALRHLAIATKGWSSNDALATITLTAARPAAPPAAAAAAAAAGGASSSAGGSGGASGGEEEAFYLDESCPRIGGPDLAEFVASHVLFTPSGWMGPQDNSGAGIEALARVANLGSIQVRGCIAYLFAAFACIACHFVAFACAGCPSQPLCSRPQQLAGEAR